MSTPRPALVNLGLILAAGLIAYYNILYLIVDFNRYSYSLATMFQSRAFSPRLYLIALSVVILLSALVARRGGLAGALIARAGWVQGVVLGLGMSAFRIVDELVGLYQSTEHLYDVFIFWAPLALGFGMALRFAEPLALDQTALRIIPPPLRAGIALSTLLMLAELHGIIFYLLVDRRSAQHMWAVALVGSIIVAFGAIVQGRRWGFALHVVNLALMACIAVAQLLGWDTLFGQFAPVLLLSLCVQAIPYLAMLRRDMWRDAAPDVSPEPTP
jgi:hypothetical protein